MIWNPQRKPRLRPIEAFSLGRDNGQSMCGLRDQTGLSGAVLGVSTDALEILMLMDGRLTCDEIRSTFTAQTGCALASAMLEELVAALDKARFLEGESFEAFYAQLEDKYSAAPSRPMRDDASLGVDGSNQPFAAMLADAPPLPPACMSAPVVGIVAPHLDYPRGWPCYAAAYATLVDRPVPDRVVILGTNHFGRSTSVVATGKAFATPLGTTQVDLSFLEAIESHTGTLRRFEMDHAREHSIELQVMWLQHIFGSEKFEIVPFLCPDPCGPPQTAPADGNGVDLKDFIAALSEAIGESERDTLLIAGADLSHVGSNFGDERTLDESFLREVRERDTRALDAVEAVDAQTFRACIARDDNPTRVCSAGCIFTLLSTLPHASAHLLAYHQAIDQETQTGVTCAAVALIADTQA